jgi:hypothetical protein
MLIFIDININMEEFWNQYGMLVYIAGIILVGYLVAKHTRKNKEK